MLEVLKNGDALLLVEAHPLAEKDGEPVNDDVTELEWVDGKLGESRAEGLPDAQAVGLLDGVELAHGEWEGDCETLGVLVEYLLLDPHADSEALTEVHALLLPHAVAVAEAQVEAVSVGEAVKLMVGLAQAEWLAEGVVQALADDVGVGGGITDAVPQLLIEAVCEAVMEGDEETLLLTEEPREALPRGDGEARSVSVVEIVEQGELDGDSELAPEAVYEAVPDTHCDEDREGERGAVAHAEEHAECEPVAPPLREPENVPDVDDVMLWEGAPDGVHEAVAQRDDDGVWEGEFEDVPHRDDDGVWEGEFETVPHAKGVRQRNG